MGVVQDFQYLKNEKKINDGSAVVQSIVIKSRCFNCWCDKKVNRSSWGKTDATEVFNKSVKMDNRIQTFHQVLGGWDQGHMISVK